MSESRIMPITEALQVNPQVSLTRGQEYPFVEMADLVEHVTQVRSKGPKEFKGSGAKFQDQDTLFARITPCLENGKIARFCGAGDVGFGSTEFIVFRGRDGLTTTDYAHYIATSPHFRSFAISKMTGSSGRQRVPVNALEHYEIRVPPLDAQRAIGKILGDLDDKIELLREMNRTLEQIARAVFRAWFVDFEPVLAKASGATSFRGMPQALFEQLPASFSPSDLGDVPTGWTVEPLSELVSQPIKRGLAPKYLKSGGVAVLNQKCVRNWEVNLDLGRRHDVETKPLKDKAVDRFDILVNSTGVGTLGRVAQVYELEEVTTVDSHLSLVKPDPSKIAPIFLGVNLTEREDEIERLGHGSTGQTELNRHKLGELNICVPGKPFQIGFEELAGPLMERKTSNRKEGAVLAALRDTLLPKLISGDLDAPDLEALGLTPAEPMKANDGG